MNKKHNIPILSQLQRTSPRQTMDEILSHYQKNWYTTVGFLYFAHASSQQIFAQLSSYRTALESCDFLMPDGIALQLFDRTVRRKYGIEQDPLPNLNGTDFTLPFLQYCHQKTRTTVHIYGTHQSIAEQSATYLRTQWLHVWYIQDGFRDLDRSIFEQHVVSDECNILLVGRGTPLQEQRVYDNREKLQQHNCIVCMVWGLFDFRVWAQTRAPRRVRYCKAEWLWRLVTDPKRNWKKVRHSLAIIPYILSYLLLKRTPNSVFKKQGK